MIPINKNGNCTSDTIGSGSRGCDIQSYGDAIGFNLHPKGFSQNVSTDSLTTPLWINLIKDFKVIPYVGIYDFTQDTPENDISTSSTGIESTLRLGKPHFSFNFDRGGCFHESLFDKRGKNRWDISLVFETGILFAVSKDKTTIGGFDCGRFDVPTFRLQQGSDPQQSMAIMQFIDAIQFNSQRTFITWEELGVNLSKIGGIIETAINYTVNPSTATTFAVKVTGSCNTDDVILNLDNTTDWRLGGTQGTPKTISTVVYRPATNDYLFTLSAALVATDKVQPTLISGSYDVAEDEMGGLYKGKAPLYTVS